MTSEDLRSQLDSDIINFLDNISNQTKNDQIQTLRHLFDKYIHLNKADYMMDHHDLQVIVGSAKTKFANSNLQIFLGDKKIKVQQKDLSNFCVIESTIEYLNKIGCLKKIAKFSKKENDF
jgi:hypothetical protein